jgi:ribonuclease HII
MPVKQKPKNRRLEQITRCEKQAQSKGFSVIAGVDEAGRGPLAGPVVAAACIIPEGVYFEGINDSKQLTPEARERLYEAIQQNPQVLSGVGVVEAVLIDQINVLQATFYAMVAAVAALRQKPEYVLVDGPYTPDFGVPSEGIVDGDTLSQSIMAAAIIAKCTRDRMMVKFHDRWPEYGFNAHKGYGTPQHLAALQLHGPCPIHRRSFEPVRVLTKER